MTYWAKNREKVEIVYLEKSGWDGDLKIDGIIMWSIF